MVKGDVQHHLKLRAADLAILPQQTSQETFQAGATTQTHTYTGLLLLDVLNLATPDFDPGFVGKKLLLATTGDRVSLADVGSRLVVPGDARGGRYVTSVVAVVLAPAH